MRHEESFLELLRRQVEEQYRGHRLGSGSMSGCFGAILCHELHCGGAMERGLSFNHLAAKWGIPISILGELIWDHCKRLETQIQVNHAYDAG
jgi:hypothetical protein